MKKLGMLYIYYDSMCFITKVLNSIHKHWSNLSQADKETKPSYELLRVSCKPVL